MNLDNPGVSCDMDVYNGAIKVIEAFMLRRETPLYSPLIRYQRYRDVVPYVSTILTTGSEARIAAWIEHPKLRLVTNVPSWKEPKVEGFSLPISELLRFVNKQMNLIAIRERLPYAERVEGTFPDQVLEQHLLTVLTRGI
jgi:hypothetical protein